MTSFDLLSRSPHKNPWCHYVELRNLVKWESLLDSTYLSCSDGSYSTPKLLEKVKNITFVIISIGGNDVYITPSVQARLISSALPCLRGRREQIAKEFTLRLLTIYREIFWAASRHSENPITIVPIIPYHPHVDFSLIAGESFLGSICCKLQNFFLPSLVRSMVLSLLHLAAKYSLPVIDLSQTFDPSNTTHYGTMEKVLSVKGILKKAFHHPSSLIPSSLIPSSLIPSSLIPSSLIPIFIKVQSSPSRCYKNSFLAYEFFLFY